MADRCTYIFIFFVISNNYIHFVGIINNLCYIPDVRKKSEL